MERSLYQKAGPNFGSTLGGTMGKGHERQIIMKTDERNVILELERKGT